MAPPLPAASQPSNTRMVETPRLIGPALQHIEACLLLRQLLVEFVVAELLSEIEVVEHVELALDSPDGGHRAVRAPSCAAAAARPPLTCRLRAVRGRGGSRREARVATAIVRYRSSSPSTMCQGAASVLVRRMARSAALTNLSNISQCFHCVLRDPPPLQRVLLERLQPLLLRLLAQVHPELHDDRAVVGQRPLEGGNLVEQRVELRRASCAGHAVENRRGIPGAQEHREAAARGQVAPVAPQPRPLALLTRRVGVAACDDPARVHPLVEQVGRLALARRIDAGEQDDDRERRGLAELLLHGEQFRPQLRDLRLVVALRELSPDFGGFKHGVPVY